MQPVAARRATQRLIVLLCALALTGCRGWPRIDPSGDRVFLQPGAPVYPVAPPPLVPDARPLYLAPPPGAAPYAAAPYAGAPRPTIPMTPAPQFGAPPTLSPPPTTP